MKYNRSEIMKEAWRLLRRGLSSITNMSQALKRAWAKAKRKMAIAIENAASRVENKHRNAIECNPIVSSLIAAGGRLWENYGKKRVYLNSNCIIAICPSLSRIEYNEISGERVSNNTRREYMRAIETASVYFDIDDQKFHVVDADKNATRIFGNLRDEMYSAIA